MRIPLTKHGRAQVVLFPVIVVTGMLVVALVWPASAPVWTFVVVETVLAALLVWALIFFRPPHCQIPPDDAVLVVPAGEYMKCLVGIGDNVRAGITPLLRYAK